MSENEKHAVVITACPDKASADEIISVLLKERLAACIQKTAVESHYRWDGKQVCSQEEILIIKTQKKIYPQVEAAVRSCHPYELPEIISIDIDKGLPAYLSWISSETS